MNLISSDEFVIGFNYENSDFPNWLALAILCRKFYLLQGFILPGRLSLEYGDKFADKLNQVMNDDDQVQIQKWKDLYDEECKMRKHYKLTDDQAFPI